MGLLYFAQIADDANARKSRSSSVGESECMIASDVVTFAHRTSSVIYLNDSEIVRLTPGSFSVSTIDEEM